MFHSKSPVMSLVAGLFCALMTPAACGAIGSPSANPDHGAPAPANGFNENPARPKGLPNNALAFNWHVRIYDKGHHLQTDRAAIVRITATSPNAPVQGNVHGGYPFRIYTLAPYTHTIWYQPGIEITTGLTATADPILPDGWYVECIATSQGRLVDAHDYNDDPMICIMSYTIQG
jgi:hypothetical protein